MSHFAVRPVRISEVKPHPNADALDVAAGGGPRFRASLADQSAGLFGLVGLGDESVRPFYGGGGFDAGRIPDAGGFDAGAPPMGVDAAGFDAGGAPDAGGFDAFAAKLPELREQFVAFAADLDAAEAVCIGDEVEDWEVVDHLDSLVDKSLIIPTQHEQGSTRYRMLEPVRQYAQERLSDTAEPIRFRAAHARYFVDFLTEESCGKCLPACKFDAIDVA